MYLYDTSLAVYILGSLDSSSPRTNFYLTESNPHEARMGTPDLFAS